MMPVPTAGALVSTTTARRTAKNALFDGFGRIAAALGSGRRAEIVEVLSQGERSVEQLADQIDQSVANTSHHLRTLARAGLVASRREGTHVHYRLASDRVLDVWLAIRELAAEQLDDLDALADAYLGDRTHIDDIDRDELLARLETGDLILIDVRPAGEYAAGHLPGAISVPPDDIDDVLDELPENREIVAYCRGPYCVYADDAIRTLTAHGRRARRLREGVPEWRRRGGPIEASIP
jgi:rhodanese-related sulfurtransferase/DNA-binding HxlR family transcriptional regulator